jgi:signal transduction histidine kinase
MPSAVPPALLDASTLALPPATPVPMRLLRHALQIVAANAFAAGFLALVHGGPFLTTLVYSECIGLSCWALVELGRLVLPLDADGAWPRGPWLVGLMAFAFLAGFGGGITLADALVGESSWPVLLSEPRALARNVAMTFVFGTGISGWFFIRSRAAVHEARAAQVAAALHEATRARLAALQSQLEPHMLFNTLANLRALIAADPARAQAMLDRLIDFLQATLAASRVAAHPLADEFARVADYLALMQVRMGERLRTRLELPPALARMPVPPLLLQPLVENAIKHGLEPRRAPGELVVSAAIDGGALVLAVDDNGVGLAAVPAAAGGPGGFGLTQVRERLRALHGEAAHFTVAARAEGGTRAEIRLPLS